MEFRFDITKIFKENISRIGNSLLPNGFIASDRRCALDTTAYVAEIINTVGQASAAAQGLNHPVTTSDRLRNSDDQVIYLMTENNGRSGLVLGLLKIGRKSLYVFDQNGDTRHVNAPCVLDFYIHELRQRAGLGKVLFEYMLEQENFTPEELAIDRPSEKLLSFLRKHYGLSTKIPQMNNFVIFDGFFGSQKSARDLHRTSQTYVTTSPNSILFGPQYLNAENKRRQSHVRSNHDLPLGNNQINGRYGAPRPQCSLNQIIHNKETSVEAEPTRKLMNDTTADIIKSFVEQTDNLSVSEKNVQDTKQEVDEPSDLITSPISSSQHDVKFSDDRNLVDSFASDNYNYNESSFETFDTQHEGDHVDSNKFRYNKRQTGKKNVSSIVVGSDEKIEFNQISDDGFGVVKINRPFGVPASYRTHEHSYDNDSVHSRDSENTHTADGFFDLKFYSHPLW
ncbi:CLUMA_CG014252, isoform A [Clunio marinus]|uniref:Alpha-tubulin N-acetyltransferase n=1 Tax=Clunio marinus TaxID=568069 RepID=A0A1J1IPJ0_9DIPT|nr:CLUMA_CG014252, isoform A [Clunio marinus]